MITSLIFFRRRPGMALAAFHDHWRERHASLVVRLPGLRRYVQNFPLRDDSPFDAVAESSFDDTRAMKALAGTPEYAAVLADEPNFIDRARMGAIVTEARVLKDGAAPPGGAKRIAFVTHPAQMPIEEFFRRWRAEGERCAAAPVRRAVQCAVRPSVYASGRSPAYDGAALRWYDDAEAARAGTAEFGEAAVLVAAERVVA